MRSRSAVLLLILFFVSAMFVACGKPESAPATSSAPAAAPAQPGTAPPPSASQPATEKPATQPSAAQPAPGNAAATKGEGAIPAATKLAPLNVVIPAGTMLTVRMGQSVGSKISQSGEPFTATLAQPVQVNGAVAVRAGAEAKGTVVEAVPLGRFKGGARLVLRLNSLNVGGKQYPVATSAVARAAKGKGKRTATMVGGGAGLGAIIGGVAGGGKGAAIGAVAGAGAGTAGSAFTGNKDIVIPAESALSFKLKEPVEIK